MEGHDILNPDDGMAAEPEKEVGDDENNDEMEGSNFPSLPDTDVPPSLLVPKFIPLPSSIDAPRST